ncbi:hypothetical protein [Streptomyces griseofuscus]|uniref:hypothetical protein n=1 Tax=Streptomyces griseofuscus TaxID=146922 RepID=UPI0037207171
MPHGHRIEDLKLSPLAVGKAGPEDRLATVTALFTHAERYTIEAIDWYLTKRRRPAQWSRLLRSIASALPWSAASFRSSTARHPI